MDEIKLPEMERPRVPLVDAGIGLKCIKRLATWCENYAKAYARAAVEADRKRRQPTWDDLQQLAAKHGAWVSGYGQFAVELLVTYGAAPEKQPHWVQEWLNAEASVRRHHQPAPAPLLARIAELEAELEKTKAIFAASCNHAAVMEMDRDARRYRWLRKRWARLDESYADGGPKITSLRVLTDQEVKEYGCWDADPESLDAAIDAAMKEQGHA